MARDLYEELRGYSGREIYPFHMPGHKRRMRMMEDPYSIDITEIDGFDDLHHAEGILLEAQQRAAALYGSEETYYLVNGSTAGILAAVSACTRRGGRILAARNCHKSVYHAIMLNGLHARWMYPDMDPGRGIYGSIAPEAVREALRECAALSGEKAEAVILTSPTYDGVVSDIRAIASVVHAYGAALIVDEAHGAHFAMHPYFPESAVACGADVVINSIHKTLPALTQTALLHVNGPRVDRARLRKYLDIYQSSSPSYVLMSGIDRCVCLMAEQRRTLYEAYIDRLEQARSRLSRLVRLHLVTGGEEELPCFAYDRSRLVISTEDCGIGGNALYELLRGQYRLQPEMASERFVVLISTVADTREGLERLCRALEEIDRRLDAKDRGDGTARLEGSRGWDGLSADSGAFFAAWSRNEEAMSMEEAEQAVIREVPLRESGGAVSAEFLYLYPPGIPLLIPGERISDQLLRGLERLQREGFSLRGLADPKGETIRLVRE